jgi:hypothetical protein
MRLIIINVAPAGATMTGHRSRVGLTLLKLGSNPIQPRAILLPTSALHGSEYRIIIAS